MAYEFKTKNTIQVLSVDSLLYEYENRIILQEVENHISEGYNKFVVDLSDMKFMNSVGLSFLISALTKSRNAGGEVVIVNILDKIAELLAITKLKSIFTVFKDADQAVDFLAKNN